MEKGLERNMDNFYDSIKLLSIHNINAFNPVKIELENVKIEIPDIVHHLDISNTLLVKHFIIYIIQLILMSLGFILK